MCVHTHTHTLVLCVSLCRVLHDLERAALTPPGAVTVDLPFCSQSSSQSFQNGTQWSPSSFLFSQTFNQHVAEWNAENLLRCICSFNWVQMNKMFVVLCRLDFIWHFVILSLFFCKWHKNKIQLSVLIIINQRGKFFFGQLVQLIFGLISPKTRSKNFDHAKNGR